MPHVRTANRNTVLGLAFSVLLVPAMYWIYTTVMIDRAERATRQIEASAHASFEGLRADQERREHERRQQAAEARLQEVAVQREAAALERERQELERRKEQAWTRFYVPQAACEKPPTWEFQVECGNRHMRARREFEVKWSRGELGASAPRGDDAAQQPVP